MPAEPRHNWHDIVGLGGSNANVGAATASGSYLLYSAGAIAVGGANSVIAAKYLDPVDYNVNLPSGAHVLQIRIRGQVICNAVAPGEDFAFQLCPVATLGGASNVQASVASVGAAVVTATITTPSASVVSHAESTAATFPAAGLYVPVLVLASNTAANAIESVGVTVQWRLI